jgi:biopolymer transport protein ExbB
MELGLFVRLFESIPAVATVLPIIFCSVLLLGIFIERIIFYRKIRYDYAALTSEMVGYISDNRLNEAVARCAAFNGPISSMLSEIAGSWNTSPDRNSMMNYHASKALRSIEKYAAVVSTISTVAPMLGLFGTVTGMMKSFGGLAGGGRESIAYGITEALITTILGLFVAIPAVIFYNYMVSRSAYFAGEIDHAVTDLGGIPVKKSAARASSK